MLPRTLATLYTVAEPNIQCILEFAGHNHYRCLAFNKEWRNACSQRLLKGGIHNSYRSIINFNSLPMLQQASEEGYCVGQAALKNAAVAGHVEIMQWAHKQLCSCAAHGARECCLNEVIHTAAQSGKLQVLNWLLPYIKHQRSSCIASAAGAGKLEAVEFLVAATKKVFNWDGGAIIENAAVAAAVGGHLHVLEWLHKCTSMCNDDVFHSAAAGGHVHVLEWLHLQQEQGDDLLINQEVRWLIATARACSIQQYAASAAASGHAHVLEWYKHRGHTLFMNAQNSTLFFEECSLMYVVHHLHSNGHL
jgi:hypothetical protein